MTLNVFRNQRTIIHFAKVKKKIMNAEHLRFKSSFDNLSANIVIADCNHIITYVNAAAMNFFNNIDSNFYDKFPHATASDLIGKNVSELYQNSEYQNNLLDNITDKAKLCFKLGDSDVEMKISPLIDKSGKQLGSMTEWQDVTDEIRISHNLNIANTELAFQQSEKGKRADELGIANTELVFQQSEKGKRADELVAVNKEFLSQKLQNQKHAEELEATNFQLMTDLMLQFTEKSERANELIEANKTLVFEQLEKETRAAELVIANEELAFQNTQKEKRAAELGIANQELAFQNAEKEKRANELSIANRELVFQNNEKIKRADELDLANKELIFQNAEKEKRAAELIIANADLHFQNIEKEKRTHELALANESIAVMNEEYITSNEELIFQNREKQKRADELSIANKELEYQNLEKEKRADELIIANKELEYQNLEKEKRADELQLIIMQNEVLNQQVNHLQKLESIGRMTAGIAHDFNNILACIMGYNEMNNDVRDEMKDESLKAELTSNIEQIANAGQRAISLIKKMMTYSRQDNTQSTKKIVVEHTPTAIKDVLEMLRPALTSRVQLEFIHNCGLINGHCNNCVSADDCELEIQIDVVALHQILTNLAVNARDAMKEQGGVITISLSKVIEKNTQCVACRALTDGEFIELSVSDKGTGIEPKVIDRIFDPFFTTKPQGEGTGLGLSTLTGLVHSALGHIMVDSDMSELNHGTSFRLLFPVIKYNLQK